jgi:hypothetical protein
MNETLYKAQTQQNNLSTVNTGSNSYKGTYPLSRQTQPTAEQIETAKRNTGTNRTTKDRNSLNLAQQTKKKLGIIVARKSFITSGESRKKSLI